MWVFLFQIKDLDPSYKTDLDLGDCFGNETPLLLLNKYGRVFQNIYSYLILCSQVHQQNVSLIALTAQVVQYVAKALWIPCLVVPASTLLLASMSVKFVNMGKFIVSFM